MRGKTAQRLLLRWYVAERLSARVLGDWGGLSLLCVWVCAVTTLTPRPPLPPAGEGEKRAMGDARPCVSRGRSAFAQTRVLPGCHLLTAREV